MSAAGPQPSVPVTVVGGYLGAGKTTLVNNLLSSAGARMAVLVNDFGEINIDADLIESHDGETMTLTNGCICCSMVDGLGVAFEQVLALSPRPDRLIIEASGVADPATVAGYCHAPGLHLDSVVVVVDIDTVRSRLADRYVGDLVSAQLRAADILMLNKTDLVAGGDREATVAATVDWLRDVCPDALIVPTAGAVVDPVLLFGSEVLLRSATVGSADSSGNSDKVSGPSLADVRFRSVSWSAGEPVHRERLERSMAELPEGVWRVKGIVRLAGDDRRAWVLQGVGRRWSLRPTGGPVESLDRSRVVAIGSVDAAMDTWLDRTLG